MLLYHTIYIPILIWYGNILYHIFLCPIIDYLGFISSLCPYKSHTESGSSTQLFFMVFTFKQIYLKK